MTVPVWPPGAVDRRRLRVGALVAEGGEGRVYRLEDESGTLYKEYREPQPVAHLQGLIDWAGRLGQDRPADEARLRAATAWPRAAVISGSPGQATGLLMPEAPSRFSVQHRRGRAYLANLSYLTADPAQRSAAYGVTLPAAGSALRVGVVYALARLLGALNSGEVPVGHGDLSHKNVLWSLERGPEVFLLDCDNAAFGSFGDADLGAKGLSGDVAALRRRAMTPNWEDPAIEPGSNPTLVSDRYSLALLFLRVVGAAHYPLQARQRQGSSLRVEFEIPAAWERLPEGDAGASLWDVCARGLSRAQPEGRPPPSQWCEVLAALLDHLGAGDVVDTVDRLQSGEAGLGQASETGEMSETGEVPAVGVGQGRETESRREAGPVQGLLDVEVRPVPTRTHPVSWRLMGVVAEDGAVGPMGPAPVPLRPGQFLREGLSYWVGAHRRAGRLVVRTGNTSAGLRRLLLLSFLDLVMAGMLLFLVGMLVSPFLGL